MNAEVVAELLAQLAADGITRYLTPGERDGMRAALAADGITPTYQWAGDGYCQCVGTTPSRSAFADDDDE